MGDLKTIYNILDINKDADDLDETDFEWSEKSLSLLKQLHPDLQKVAHEVIKLTPFELTILPSTIRTIDQQIAFVKDGKSKTYDSRHLYFMALDFAPIIKGKITWEIPYYKTVCPLWQQAADKVGVKITLGANFVSFKDYVHVELNKQKYPNDKKIEADIRAYLKSKGIKT